MAAECGKKARVESELGACTLLFASFFALYALTSSPAIGWLDSPEFIAQSLSLGNAHSPGHPLVGLLGHLASLVPIGDSVWRVNLMSSLCAAGAVTLLYKSLHLLLERIANRAGSKSTAAMAMSIAATAGCCYALWGNAGRAEVYALQALLSCAAFFALLRFDVDERPRELLLAAFLLALGLANHHLMTLLILLPAAVFVLVRPKRPSVRTLGLTAGVGLLGLMSLVYLPVRSLAHPLVNFGAPHTLERFVWTLRGAAFSKSVTNEHVSSPMLDSMQIIVALTDALSLPLFFLAAQGMYCALRAPGLRATGLFLGAVMVLTVAIRAVLGFDPQTPDHQAYLLPAMLALWLFAAVAIATLCKLASAAKRPLLNAPAICALALALLFPIQLASQWQRGNQRASFASDDLAHWSLHSLPANSLVLSAYFQTRFRLWALQAVEGSRPDVAILDRSFLTYPGMAEEASLQHPELAPLIASPLRAGEPSPMPLLLAIAGQRPLFAELHPNVDPALAAVLRPEGAFARAFHHSSLATRDHRARTKLATRLAHASDAERHEAKGALLWHDATRLSQYCLLGDTETATQVYSDALVLAPNEAMLDAIASACGIGKPALSPQ